MFDYLQSKHCDMARDIIQLTDKVWQIIFVALWKGAYIYYAGALAYYKEKAW